MARPTKVVVNCETGVQEVIELTDAEIAELEAAAAKAAEDRLAAEQEAIAKQAEKEAIAAKLGLTKEELLKLIS